MTDNIAKHRHSTAIKHLALTAPYLSGIADALETAAVHYSQMGLDDDVTAFGKDAQRLHAFANLVTHIEEQDPVSIGHDLNGLAAIEHDMRNRYEKFDIKELLTGIKKRIEAKQGGNEFEYRVYDKDGKPEGTLFKGTRIIDTALAVIGKNNIGMDDLKKQGREIRDDGLATRMSEAKKSPARRFIAPADNGNPTNRSR